MRRPSTFFRGAAVVLAVACGGKTISQTSEFPPDAGNAELVGPGGDCFCPTPDAGVTAPFPETTDDGGGGFADATGFDGGLPPCPTAMPEAGAACPDNRNDECTYVVAAAPGHSCHWHCRCVVIPEEETWSCTPDLDCDP